jgi:hypothetical protein
MTRFLSGSPLAVLLLGLASLSCSRVAQRGYPMYGKPARPSAEVAQIATQLFTVDDVTVPEGVSQVEVLPGCHQIRLSKNWIQEENGAFARMDASHMLVWIDAKAGHLYVIDARFGRGSGMSSSKIGVTWVLKAFDAEGNEVPDWKPPDSC